MHLSYLNYAIWFATTSLEILVCVLAYRRGLYRKLPFFTAYVTALVLLAGFQYVVFRAFGYGSWAAYYTAWITDAALLAARGLAIGELCFYLLRSYPGIWRLAWRVLAGVSIIFLLHAAIESASQLHWLGPFVLALDRDLELAATAVLIALLLIGRYYTLEMDLVERRIATGLCIYSASIVITNALMFQAAATHLPSWFGYHEWLARVQAWWNVSQGLAAVFVLGVWALALRLPVYAVRPAPVLLPASAYQQLSPAVNFRLRTMNARLLDLLKS